MITGHQEVLSQDDEGSVFALEQVEDVDCRAFGKYANHPEHAVLMLTCQEVQQNQMPSVAIRFRDSDVTKVEASQTCVGCRRAARIGRIDRQ